MNKMYRHFLFTICSCLSLCARQQTALASDETEIRRSFEQYKKAIVAGEGKTACALLSKDSLKYYEDAKNAALKLDDADLRNQPVMQRFAAIRMRTQYTFKELKPLSPLRLCEIGVEKGWVDRAGTSANGLGKLEVSGDTAKGNMIFQGRELEDPRAPHHFFAREDKSWKMDIAKGLDFAAQAIQAISKQMGKAENEFLLTSLQGLTGYAITGEIFSLNAYQKGFHFEKALSQEELDQLANEAEKGIKEAEKELEQKKQ